MTIVKHAGGTRGMRGARLATLVTRLLRPAMIRHHRRGGDTFRGFAVLYLTTLGAKTGRWRQNALAYLPDGDGAWLVVASFGGAAHHPGWYHNLAAHPDQVSVEVGGRRHHVRPEQLDGDRRAQAWTRIVAELPDMATYQEKTDRLLPVLRLSRVR